MIKGNIERLTLANRAFRKILHTTNEEQLVLMSLKTGQEIGMELHEYSTQFIRVEKGKARAIIDGKRYILKDGDFIIIKARARHNIINIGNTSLKLYTIYAPPVHNER
jgi:mannose-6-phosphate isomerase-like protein (cupin superfamily)